MRNINFKDSWLIWANVRLLLILLMQTLVLLTIWFIGPLIAFNGMAPLEHRWIREVLILALIAYFSWRWLRPPPLESLDQEAMDYSVIHSSEIVMRVIVQLRSRSKQLKTYSRFGLVLILVSLIGGMNIFHGAEKSASDTETEGLRRLIKEKSDVLALLADTDVEITGCNSKKSLANPSVSSQDILEKVLPSCNLDSLKVRKQVAEQELKDLDHLLEKRLSLPDQGAGNTYLISSLSTKIGSVAILLFLVQVLINLYRYNIRLSAFYDSRADCLQLASISPEITLQTLVLVLSPDKFDFGKSPNTPIEVALELAKEIASVRKE